MWGWSVGVHVGDGAVAVVVGERVAGAALVSAGVLVRGGAAASGRLVGAELIALVQGADGGVGHGVVPSASCAGEYALPDAALGLCGGGLRGGAFLGGAGLEFGGGRVRVGRDRGGVGAHLVASVRASRMSCGWAPRLRAACTVVCMSRRVAVSGAAWCASTAWAAAWMAWAVRAPGLCWWAGWLLRSAMSFLLLRQGIWLAPAGLPHTDRGRSIGRAAGAAHTPERMPWHTLRQAARRMEG